MNNLIFLFIFVPILAIVLLALNFLLSAHRPDESKVSPYECGFSVIEGQTRSTFQVHFYLVGLLFLVFDLEILLLMPIGVTLYQVSTFGFSIAIIFFVVLTVGFILEIGSGAISLSNASNNIIDKNSNHTPLRLGNESTIIKQINNTTNPCSAAKKRTEAPHNKKTHTAKLSKTALWKGRVLLWKKNYDYSVGEKAKETRSAVRSVSIRSFLIFKFLVLQSSDFYQRILQLIFLLSAILICKFLLPCPALQGGGWAIEGWSSLLLNNYYYLLNYKFNFFLIILIYWYLPLMNNFINFCNSDSEDTASDSEYYTAPSTPNTPYKVKDKQNESATDSQNQVNPSKEPQSLNSNVSESNENFYKPKSSRRSKAEPESGMKDYFDNKPDPNSDSDEVLETPDERYFNKEKFQLLKEEQKILKKLRKDEDYDWWVEMKLYDFLKKLKLPDYLNKKSQDNNQDINNNNNSNSDIDEGGGD